MSGEDRSSVDVDICHVLMTRFNLATPGREAAHRRRNDWLSERFDLFERYCLPSVASQDRQDFRWIVYFDDETPQWARERVDRAREIREFFPYYTGLFDATGWARTVREIIGPPRPGRLIITSNLDNDDGLAISYLSRIRRAAGCGQPPKFAVNIPDGIVLAGYRTFGHRHRQNAFTNLVERDDHAFVTTMTIRHMDLHRVVPIIQASGTPGWLQVVHGDNVSNKARGKLVDPAQARGWFAPKLLDGARSPGLAEMAIDMAVAPLRSIRDGTFRVARIVFPADSS
jgi:hypothetical protein